MAVLLSDDRVELIKLAEYVPELEEKVKHFLSTSIRLPKNDILYSRLTIPDFKDAFEQVQWENKEIERCKGGHNGMVGKMYFYFNYGWMMNLELGKLPPEFRVVDHEWFKLIQDCQESREWGIVCVKRRRVGASWKEAADVLHDCLFTPFYHVGMNSKSERDSHILFRKVKFVYDNLPDFLRISTAAGKSKDKIDFSYYGKDTKGNKIKQGTQSEIIVVAPVDSAYEGMMLNKWICDEAGKIVNLPQMWSYTEDCLMQETRRVGIPVLFGTAGDIGRDGAGLKNMWDYSETYKLKRFFFAGWMGLSVDKYGNDNMEETIRWIVYQRRLRENLSVKHYSDFLQRYPLTIPEAFSQASEGGLGNIIKINAQETSLAENPSVARRGKFALNMNDEVVFKLDPLGKGILYEHSKSTLQRGYVAGCDPADHDDVLDESSDLSLYIMKKRHGVRPPAVVFEYTDRPQNLSEYFIQAALALTYFNKTKVLIERNRYRMISDFDALGYKHLLHRAPQGIMRLVKGRSDTIGVHMTKELKIYKDSLIEAYIEDHCDEIPSVELLGEFKRYGAENTDKVDAFGMALIQLKEESNILARKSSGPNKTLPSYRYKRTHSGAIVRLTD